MTLHADWLLPPDLEFTIIDHFMDDKATLASCSLVCSRWLLPSRKYLFQDVTIQLVNHSSLDPIAGFLYIIESSREMNPEWAIRTYIKKLRLEGRPNSRGYDVGTPAASFTLSAIRALLSKLPHLASLYMTKSVILDNASQKPNEKQAQYPRFELDELSIFECTTYSQDPRPLLSLICTFSRIGLLSVDRWGQWRPRPLPVFPPPPFSPPVIRSLAVELVEEVAARALYALLASSPSVVSAYLARISVYVAKWEDIQRLADFANLAGTALRAIELRVQRNVRLDLLHGTPVATSATLSSLTLSFPCLDDWAAVPGKQADDTRQALHEYAQVLGAHRAAFPRLTDVRLEMRPVGWAVLNAFVRVVQDVRPRPAWPGGEVYSVVPNEAERSGQVWVSLEDVLCRFRALEHVEFVLYETPQPGEALTEAAKGVLRGALEGRLPRLGSKGIARLVFEHLSR